MTGKIKLNEFKNSPYFEALAIAMLMQQREVDRRPNKYKRYKLINLKFIKILGNHKVLIKRYLLSLDDFNFQYDEMEAYLAGLQSHKKGLACGLGLILHLYEMQNSKFVQTSKRRVEQCAAKLRKALGRNSILLDEFTQLYQIFNCSSQPKAKYFFNLGYQTNRERNV